MNAFCERSQWAREQRERERQEWRDWAWQALGFVAAMIGILAFILSILIAVSMAARAADHSAVLHGKASWYWQSQRLACGGRHAGRSEQRMGAAMRGYPCGAQVIVVRGKRAVVVTVMDRGPFVRGRVIDLFPAPARALGMTQAGVVSVSVEAAR